jgi:hypothetical protein
VKLAPTLLAVLLLPAMARANEEPRHDVAARGDGFEIRRYAPALVAETEVEGGFKDARNAAFRRLFRYISGENAVRADIAMTAPVTTAPTSAGIAMTAPVATAPRGGGFVMQFFVPRKYTLDTVPAPTDPAVRMREVGERWIAARTFSGRASEGNAAKHEAALRALVGATGCKVVGPAWFAVYDGPFTPWFLRRNEVLLELAGPCGG